jgi:hypothetical protein
MFHNTGKYKFPDTILSQLPHHHIKINPFLIILEFTVMVLNATCRGCFFNFQLTETKILVWKRILFCLTIVIFQFPFPSVSVSIA